MEKNKYISIAIILFVFVLFVLLYKSRAVYYNVLKVNSPFEVIADYNDNGIEDDDEIVKLNYGYDYISKSTVTKGRKYGLDEYNSYAFSYLTEKFTKDVLSDKRVQFKSINNKKELFIGREKYRDILYKSGLFFKDGKPINGNAFNGRLKQIKKSDFRIYNPKSNKYHTLTCKYAHKAHNYLLLASYQMPKGASPCRYCYSNKYNKQKSHNHKKYVQKTSYTNLMTTSGSIKIILNDYTTNLIPNRKCNTNICNELVKQIDNAKYSIDIAIYGYDRVPRIEQAIKRAIARGVKIRLVYDITSSNTNIYSNTFYFSKLISDSICDRATAEVKNPSLYTNSIMHDKFYIFDNSIVITGSANLSHTDMSDYNSNAVLVIHSKNIAEIYTKEFEQMYNKKFHYLKSAILNKENIRLGPSVLSVYFSPADNIINTVLIPAINKAVKYIYIPIFAITDKPFADALIRAKRRGVDVRVIVDATNAKNTPSQHRYLRQNGVLAKTENYAGKLHSKSIIIDDTCTIIGSMNFSKSGNTKNDENMVLLKDTTITRFYRKFFEYIWSRIPDYWLTHDVSAESVYSTGSCSDGIDNDYDGKTDLEDEGCKFKPAKLPK